MGTCFGFTFEFGAKLIGWLGGILSIAAMIVLKCFLDFVHYHEELAKKEEGMVSLLKINLAINLSLFAFFVNAIFHFCVVWGTIKKHHMFLQPWLIYTPLLHGIFFTAFVVSAICNDIHLGCIILEALPFAIHARLWIIVYSGYKKIKPENNAKCHDDIIGVIP